MQVLSYGFNCSKSLCKVRSRNVSGESWIFKQRSLYKLFFFFFLAVVEVVCLPLIKLEITIYLPHCDEKLKWNMLQLKTETRAARK